MAIENFPDKVTEYIKGKKSLMGLFIGEVMNQTGGRSDPESSSEMLFSILDD